MNFDWDNDLRQQAQQLNSGKVPQRKRETEEILLMNLEKNALRAFVHQRRFGMCRGSLVTYITARNIIKRNSTLGVLKLKSGKEH
jgi:hypothetical protein